MYSSLYSLSFFFFVCHGPPVNSVNDVVGLLQCRHL